MGDVRRLCPHGIRGCICMQRGARPDMHGQKPRACACGGQDGLHAMGCLGPPRIVGFDLPKLDLSEPDAKAISDAVGLSGKGER